MLNPYNYFFNSQLLKNDTHIPTNQFFLYDFAKNTYATMAPISNTQPPEYFYTSSTSTLAKDYNSNFALGPHHTLTSNLQSASAFITSGHNYDTNSNDASYSTYPLQPHDSFTDDSIPTTTFHASPTSFEHEDPVSTSDSQPTIRNRSNSISTITRCNYDINSYGVSCSSFLPKPHDSMTKVEHEDPISTSGSQPTIRNRSNSAMEEDLDDSADTTTPNTLTTSRNYRRKLKQREKLKEKRKTKRLQTSKFNTHDKDEVS